MELFFGGVRENSWGELFYKEFKELFFRSKNHPRYRGVKITPKKELIMYLNVLHRKRDYPVSKIFTPFLEL